MAKSMLFTSQPQLCCAFLYFTSVLFCVGNCLSSPHRRNLNYADHVGKHVTKIMYTVEAKEFPRNILSLSDSILPFGDTSHVDYVITHPVRVDHEGNFISHDVRHFTYDPAQEDYKSRRRRNVGSSSRQDSLFFSVSINEQLLHLNLSENKNLVRSSFVVERLRGKENDAEKFSETPPHHRTSLQRGTKWPCHFRGHVIGHPGSSIAISTCEGLTGLIRLQDGDYFIEPLTLDFSPTNDKQPHKIYKRSVANPNAGVTSLKRSGIQPTDNIDGESRTDRMQYKRKWYKGRRRYFKSLQGLKQRKKDAMFCGVTDTKSQYHRELHRRAVWEAKRRKSSPLRRNRRRRSLSLEHWIEMMVVVDWKMTEYYELHHKGDVERYVLTVINMVTELFHDVSIGNALHVTLIRMIILEDETSLKVTSHAEKTLDNFCRWSKRMNPRSDYHANHHDVAVLLTRQNLCSHSNTSCETLGLAHVAGMCQPHRSCNVNQDTGLSVAFTVAHELGHNFAMHHDGQLNNCEPEDDRPRVMAPHLTSNNQHMTWSTCSRRYVTRFLDRNWGFCLMDHPSPEHDHFEYPPELPGVLYDADHQCRLMFGPESRHCRKVENMCNRLWCLHKGTCRSRLHAAVPGTKCALGRWCYGGACVRVGKRPSVVDGAWGPWTKWSRCSRTCGVGVSFSARYCDQPTPRHGGRYCLGERRRYRTCNVWKCSKSEKSVSFRTEQCSAFNNVLYRNHTYTWLPVDSPIYPCELHCYTRDSKRPFADRLKDKVVDGTKCFSYGNDICVDGICKRLGCDLRINSLAEEDKCGVCRGDGSSCAEVNSTFTQQIGDEYVDIGLIPKGARHIKISEAQPSGNFLALRNPLVENEFYLNGNFMIQWDFQFDLAGTVFNYRRMNKTLDNITADGPVTHDVVVTLLFVEENPGVDITYTLPHNVSAVFDDRKPEFEWMMKPWSPCTRTCGVGVQISLAICVERKSGIVEEDFCDPETRPNDNRRVCSNPRCPPEWIAGPWQPCTVTCGGGLGRQTRTVLCVRSIKEDEQIALNKSECRYLIEPAHIHSCSSESQIPCPVWRIGPWGNCSAVCDAGHRNRTVSCVTYFINDVINIDADAGIMNDDDDDEYTELLPNVDDETHFRDLTLVEPKDFLTMGLVTVVKKRRERNLLEGFDYDVEDDQKCNPKKRPESTGPCFAQHCSASVPGSLPYSDSLSPSNDTDSPVFPLNDSVTFDKDLDSAADLRLTSNITQSTDDSEPAEDLLDVEISFRCLTCESSLQKEKKSVTEEHNKTVDGTPAPFFNDIEGSGIEEDSSNMTATSTTHSDQTTASYVDDTPTQVPKWLTGIWGQCSTSCGVGAKFRKVICSSGSGKCDEIEKPAPAQRCNLKPCAAWQYGGWTKCSRTCGEGRKRRKIQCRDTRSSELLRPYHCASVPKLPRVNSTCNMRSCLPWRVSRWSMCSVTCGNGVQRRRVACRLKGTCKPSQKPVGQKNCRLRPCVEWKTSHWSRCPVNCGNGLKHRLVTCVEKATGKPSTFCNPVLKPDTAKKCNKGSCRVTDYDFTSCAGDRLKASFCVVLKDWGKCVQPSLAVQCCSTCKTYISVRNKDKIS